MDRLGANETETNRNPYLQLDDHSFWRRAVSRQPWNIIDPMVDDFPIIERNTRIVSAGSCFAQHIATYIRQSGYNYYVAETESGADPVFSAQYGNIYTARHLLQLIRRAYGDENYDISGSFWQRKGDGWWLDAFRPNSVPAHPELDTMLAKREKHLQCVRDAFENLDVFVFTFGLTECWLSANDGMTFPVAPGILDRNSPFSGFSFKNLSADETASDFLEFLTILRKVNPTSKVIVTVSPIPLVATYEKQHVLVSNCYSKAALRVAAQEVCQEAPDLYYFPSYEIFTGHYTAGKFYQSDMREAKPSGVAYAMRLFRKHFMVGKDYETEQEYDVHRIGVTVECDEELLDMGSS